VTGDGLEHESVQSIVNWPRVSPDGQRRAATRLDPITGVADVWVEDFDRGTRTRVTHEALSAQLPVWSPDGTRLAYLAGFSAPVLTIARADGTGTIGTLPCPRERCEPTDWSRDGRWLVVTAQTRTGSGSDVWLLPVAGGESRPVLHASYVERDARLSTDGRLVAYVSEESGRPEVSVRSLDEPPRRVVVSPGGGSQPVWARDGQALFFVDASGALRRVRVRAAADGRPELGPMTAVPVPAIGTGHWSTQYDVTPEVTRVHFLDQRSEPAPGEVGLVLGWRSILK
jgi:Tol biopolymer transport system component